MANSGLDFVKIGADSECFNVSKSGVTDRTGSNRKCCMMLATASESFKSSSPVKLLRINEDTFLPPVRQVKEGCEVIVTRWLIFEILKEDKGRT